MQTQQTVSHIGAVAFAAFMVLAGVANAQDPVRLPATTVRAQGAPGALLLTGIVTDTLETMLGGVELTIPSLQKRVLSADDGTFRFEGVKEGTYTVRARKVGFAPQIKEVKVGKKGAGAVFALMPLSHFLLPTVITATTGGLSGVVADTAYQPVAGALVSILGNALSTTTDSSGRFFLPATAGRHMIHIAKTDYNERVVGVSIPADSGRHLALQLGASTGPVPVRSAWNIRDFATRLAWRNRLTQPFYTREDLREAGFNCVIDAVRAGGMAQYDQDCRAVKNGGPDTIEIGPLTIDDVEAIEIRSSARSGGPTTPGRKASTPSPRARAPLQSPDLSNAARANFENQSRFCPLVYVWLR